MKGRSFPPSPHHHKEITDIYIEFGGAARNEGWGVKSIILEFRGWKTLIHFFGGGQCGDKWSQSLYLPAWKWKSKRRSSCCDVLNYLTFLLPAVIIAWNCHPDTPETENEPVQIQIRISPFNLASSIKVKEFCHNCFSLEMPSVCFATNMCLACEVFLLCNLA